jgi:hypothetical protein
VPDASIATPAFTPLLLLLLLLLRRIAKATGAQVVLTLADMEGNESFDASCLGEAEEVLEKRVADDAMVSDS